MTNKGFTLAEVLITLGVIGVVATMTMPALIQNYQKNLAVTRLKHFTSTLQQAGQMRSKDYIEGNFLYLKERDIQVDPFNGEQTRMWFDIYFAPYIKTTEIQTLNKGVLAKFPNGSAGYWQRNANCGTAGSTSCMFVTFCPEYKYCKDIDNLESFSKGVDGKHTFVMHAAHGDVPVYTNLSRDELLNKCKSSPFYCSSLIQYDGWKIEKDYPW